MLYLVYHVNASSVDNTSNGVLDEATVLLPFSAKAWPTSMFEGDYGVAS